MHQRGWRVSGGRGRIRTRPHLDAYRLLTNLFAPSCQAPLGLSCTAAHRPALVCHLCHAELFSSLRRLLCLIRFQRRLPALYTSRPVQSTCPNALDQRITYKCDLSLPLSLSFHLFSLSVFFGVVSFSNKHIHPLTHTYVYSQPYTHKTQTPTNKCAHTRTHKRTHG